MRANVAILIIIGVLIWAAALVYADGLNLAPYTRVTATDTRNTFLTLWPRETDDAPYTVRDDNPETSWKIARDDTQILTFDFAPLHDDQVTISEIKAKWFARPAGSVRVMISDYCGGTIQSTTYWVWPYEILSFENPLPGFCVEITFVNPGPAALEEMQLLAEGIEGEPSIELESIGFDSPNTCSISFYATTENTHHCEIHYLRDEDETPSTESLVDVLYDSGEYWTWAGPRPVMDNAFISIVPVGFDGRRGDALKTAAEKRESPTDTNSGVVEGFYGRPWSWTERRAMIRRLARIGMGLYIYGPKNDPLHRDDWRIPYSNEDIEKFISLQKLGSLVGLTMSFGISPGKDMDMDDPGERATLLAKLTPFIDGGYKHITLLLDDIEFGTGIDIDGALGQQHVGLCNWLKGELDDMAGENVTLWMVPTVYSDRHRNDHAGGADYLDELVNLHPQIMVMWTGTNVFSKYLEAADMADVTSRIGRMPVIWDNEHATDGGDGFVGKVYLAPYDGRSADLLDAVHGIVANPSILGAANRLMIGTYGDYLDDPGDYNPFGSIILSGLMEPGSKCDTTLPEHLTDSFFGSGIYGMPAVALPYNPGMDRAIDEFKEAVTGNRFSDILDAGENLLNVAAGMAVTRSRLYHSCLSPDLVDDLWFPAERLLHEGHALLYLLRWAGKQYGQIPTDGELDTVSDFLEKALGVRYQVSLFKVNFLRSYLRDRQYPPNDFKAPEISLAVQGRAQANSDVRISLNMETIGQRMVTVHGLPDAYVFGDDIVCTPPHAGVWYAVVVIRDEKGWAFDTIEFVVEKEPDTGDDDDHWDDDDYGDDWGDDWGDDEDWSDNKDENCCGKFS